LQRKNSNDKWCSTLRWLKPKCQVSMWTCLAIVIVATILLNTLAISGKIGQLQKFETVSLQCLLTLNIQHSHNSVHDYPITLFIFQNNIC
ncbi:hypothetical protein T05_12443, partial [Trichinella murrelli]